MAQGCSSVVEIVNGSLMSVTPAMWECQRCTLLNSDHLHRCQVCESPRKMRLPTLSDVEPGTDQSLALRRPGANEIEAAEGSNSVRNGNSNCNSSASGSSLANSSASTPLSIADLQTARCDDIPLDNDEEWQCSACTFNCNPSFAKRCETCGKERLGTLKVTDLDSTRQHQSSRANIDPDSATGSSIPISTVPPAEATWDCSKCTFKNSPDLMTCSMCGQMRPVTAAETWRCAHCTLENLSSDLVCNACQRSKGSCEGTSRSLQSSPPVLNRTRSLAKPFQKSPQFNGVQQGQLHRQESSLVEDIRRIEEKEASELRMTIISHCKKVCGAQYCNSL